MFDIIGGCLKTLDGDLIINLVEYGVVVCDISPVVIEISVINLGYFPATKYIRLKSGGIVLEVIPLTLRRQETKVVTFTNSGVGYTVPDGTAKKFAVEAG